MGRSKGTSPIKGTWHIVEMELWDREDLDLVGPAYVEFGPSRFGSMQFVALEASIDYRVTLGAVQTKVDFTWEGYDEGDHVCGRAWAVVRGDQLEGKVFIHNGDESDFVAMRRGRVPTRRSS